MLVTARHRIHTAFAVAMLTVFAVAACGSSDDGSGPGDPDVFDPSGDPQDDNGSSGDGDGGDGGGDAIGVGDTEAPVVVTIDGVSFGYRDGSCQVDDEIVRFRAHPDSSVIHGQSSALNNSVDITWFPSLDHLPHAAQHAAFIVNSTIEADPAPFSLTGASNSESAAASRWDATVSGTTVEFDMTLVDSSQFDEPETTNVQITATCDDPVLGNGPPPGSSPVDDQNQMVDPHSVLSSVADGEIEVTFQGTTHNVDYLTFCSIGSQEVQAEGSNDELTVRAGYNEVQVQVGDSRLLQGRPTFGLPETIQVPYEGSSTRTWSGTLVDDDGNEEEVSVAVTCAG